MIKLDIVHRKYSAQLLIQSKFNLVIGDSGSGKTLMSKMVSALSGSKGFVEVNDCRVFSEVGYLPSTFQQRIQEERGSVFLLDESSVFVSTNAGAELLLGSPNYFIISGRDNFNRLPYGIRSIFELSGSPRAVKMVPVATELQLHRRTVNVHTGDTVIMEGSGLDYVLVSNKLSIATAVITSHGKDKLHALLRKTRGQQAIIIVDWCGTAGASMYLFDSVISGSVRTIFSPSFEFELLQYWGEYPEMQAESALDSESEEKFYVDKASDLLCDTVGLRYTKSARGTLAELLSTGKIVINNTVYRMPGVDKFNWLYPELRIVDSNRPKHDDVPRLELE